MTLNWSTASRDDKNAAIHVHVAGKTINGPDEGCILIPQRALMPDYLSNANALIPLLDRAQGGWKCDFNPYQKERSTKVYSFERNPPSDGLCVASSTVSFCEAAAIALLRAHGVEVLT